jgi:hypothetical protein
MRMSSLLQFRLHYQLTIFHVQQIIRLIPGHTGVMTVANRLDEDTTLIDTR